MAKSEDSVLCTSDSHVVMNNLVEIKNAKGDIECSKTDYDSQIWLPPEPDDHGDDDDDDEEFNDGMKWGKPSDLSGFGEEGSGSFRLRLKDEKRKAMNEIMNGKFKALVENVLNSVGICISCSRDDGGETWVDIVTSLSWEAAAFLKQDSFEGKTMDLDGYVKVKCIATGSRSQSEVFKGLVFKKHAAHKHMMQTKFKKPKLLLIKGALSVSEGFSSLESVNREKNRLDSVIGMIEKCNPNVVLVEKTVSRDIQESILAKGMILVFEMKKHRLERIARCTGSPIFSSFDKLSEEKLRQCDSFYFEKVIEEHDGVDETGKKPKKTLMFLEGCPKRMGCTILLKGSHSEELKKIKSVVQFAVVMAYHLILESSFLLNQREMFSTIGIIANEEIIIPQSTTDLEASDANLHISKELLEKQSQNIGAIEDSLWSYNLYNRVLLESLSSLLVSLKKIVRLPYHLFCYNSGTNTPSPSESSVRLLSSDADVAGKVNSNEVKITLNNDHLHSSLRCTKDTEEVMRSKDEISSVLESESILVLMSKRNAKRGIICEQNRFSCIKFYKFFDDPLGKVLRDNFLDQKLLCRTCNEPQEAHAYYYAHHNTQLTIQVKRLPVDQHLPGETEEKLWMWSCCGKCKPFNGNLKFTKRVLLSTSARNLSFGKFLELGFSNHSSCDTSSTCGHFFYKDYFHFFGLGSMVAMFRYSSITPYSVSLPLWKVEFIDSSGGDFLNKEVEDVHDEGLSMFYEVEYSLKKIDSEFVGSTLNHQGSLMKFSDIEEILSQEREQFEVDMENTTDNWVHKPLFLNHIQWELLLESCIWDHRLHSLLKPQESVIRSDFRSSLSAQLANEKGWMWAPFQQIQIAFMNDLQRGVLPEFKPINNYASGSTIHKMLTIEGSRLHLPLTSENENNNDIKYMVSDYENELSSVVSCALAYLKDRDITTPTNDEDTDSSESSHFFSFEGLELLDNNSFVASSTRDRHPVVSMGRVAKKIRYLVGCLYANEFKLLRSQCGLSELDFMASLSRCKHWDAKGGKSKSFFSKTLDGRFIIKEISNTEFRSLFEFASKYFDYMNQCFNQGNQTCLAKILGLYQVKIIKTGVRHDLMVMENITYCRNVIRQYDLKGALHSRFNSPTVDGVGDVFLDQNFVNDMNVSPIYVNKKAKRNLQRAVWNDTVFLNSINVMDYSLLVGVDAAKRELVCGIIDYVRQFTLDKQLENWVKSFVVPKNQMPTVISPIEYKKRFRKFIDTHFLSVPDDWCSQRSSKRCVLCD